MFFLELLDIDVRMYLMNIFGKIFVVVFMVMGMSLMVQQVVVVDEYFIDGGVVVGGIDVVFYYIDGVLVQGLFDFVFEYQGVIWYFVFVENKVLFDVNFVKYVLVYGGWCLVGVSKGKKVLIVLDFWVIVDGQFYFNSSLVV